MRRRTPEKFFLVLFATVAVLVARACLAPTPAFATGGPCGKPKTGQFSCTGTLANLPSVPLQSGWQLQNNGSAVVYVGTNGLQATAGNWNVPAGGAQNDMPEVNLNLLYCITGGSTVIVAWHGCAP